MAKNKKIAAGPDESIEKLSEFLKKHKDDHYNFEDTVNYQVSTGSLNLDIVTNGGFGPGLQRFCGTTEGGKTSELLEIIRNFLATVPNSKAMYAKCEGRLSVNVQNRSGIKFVYTAAEWVVGTCFVFECNIHETIMDMFRMLIKDNPNAFRYAMALDSVDGMISKGDMDKTSEEAKKVSGGAVLSSDFMRRVSVSMTKRGHMMFFLSQVRAEIVLDKYKKPDHKITNASGGFALQHYPDWVFEFEAHHTKKALILENPKDKVDPDKNPIIGHYASLIVKKSTNETTGRRVRYPIKYGRTNGTSIWTELEVFEFLEALAQIKEAKNWLTFDDDLSKEIKDAGIEVPEQINGKKKFLIYLEEHSDLTKFLYKRLFEIYSSSDTQQLRIGELVDKDETDEPETTEDDN